MFVNPKIHNLKLDFPILYSTIFILYFIFIPHCFSQPQLEWVKEYPDTTTFRAIAFALALDDSGYVYITGHIENQQVTKVGYCTIKYSPSGTQQWVAIYLNSNSGGRYAYAIAVDKNYNVFVTGYSFSFSTYFDYCTIKYNSNGIQQWVQFYDGPSHGQDQAQKIAVDNAGNIYVTGFSELNGGGNDQNTTIKYSTDGRQLWVQRYGYPHNSRSNGIAIDDSCNIYITGVNNDSAVTIKYDSSGNQLWAERYCGKDGYTEATAIAMDKYNIYVTGFSTAPLPRFQDFFTIKYSTSGTQQWLKRFNSDTTTYSRYESKSIVIDSSRNLYISGFYEPDQGAAIKFCIVKYSNNGDLLWVQKDTTVLSNEITSMVIDLNNSIYIAGKCDITGQNYVFDYFVIKYDSSGREQWYVYNQNGTELTDIKTDRYLNFYLTGQGAANMCTIKYSQPVGIVKFGNQLPNRYALFQNYPNPFNPSTEIKYAVPKDGNVSIKVFDVLGREVLTLVNGYKIAGYYEVKFDGANLSSGLYFYKIESGNFKEVKKMVLIR